MRLTYLAIPLFCLFASIITGVFGRRIGRAWAHRITIFAVALATVLSLVVFADVLSGNTFNGTVYTWGVSGGVSLQIGFLIDELSATMMVVVNFVSLMVHIYTIGYMREDPGYQRFFSYISLFTFAMLMLVMSNNFLQLFFGWEGVGLVSYLLIGFWFDRESAVFASLKAFLVNRVGDLGFLLGIAAILLVFGNLDYETVFAAAPSATDETLEIIPGVWWNWMTVICLLLFVGAMGKSAQVPLHVWLPDSMEGPTPISALIHAATMVTAGIFMVARMSPLFEYSETALSVVMVIGAITALSMALVGIVQNDIKRVVAYSTLSQLGYMTVALGASAYAAGIFHLGTHAFFKALLFLAAGSVIIALHHEQDMRKMGALKGLMPITYITAVIGTLALAGIPPFAGFFSKDAIIEAVHASHLPGSGFAHFAVTVGVFITAFYSFRLLIMTFHGESRIEEDVEIHVKESPWVVTIPLIMLAIPSVIIGAIYFEPMLFQGFFGDSLKVLPEHDTLRQVGEAYHGKQGLSLVLAAIVHGVTALPFWLALSGIATAIFLYGYRPDLPVQIGQKLKLIYTVLVRKYGFDELYEFLFAAGARQVGRLFWRVGDVRLIDGLAVNGTARAVAWLSGVIRHVQSGFIYHYVFAMILGLFLLMTWFVRL